jgi:hypothetical protein
MIVKVSIPEGSATAVIVSKDEKVRMFVPAALIQRRLEGSTVAFFHAEDDHATGSVEIGERVPDQTW